MNRSRKAVYLLLLALTAGCSDSGSGILDRLDQKRQAAIAARSAMVEYLSDSSESERLLREVEATLREKNDRLSKNQNVDDLESKSMKLLESMQVLNDRGEALGKTLATTVVDYYSFLASVSETCGDEELDVSVIERVIPTKSYVEPGGKNVEQLFWESKWGYDDELQSPDGHPDCEAAIPRIAEGKALLENRLT